MKRKILTIFTVLILLVSPAFAMKLNTAQTNQDNSITPDHLIKETKLAPEEPEPEQPKAKTSHSSRNNWDLNRRDEVITILRPTTENNRWFWFHGQTVMLNINKDLRAFKIFLVGDELVAYNFDRERLDLEELNLKYEVRDRTQGLLTKEIIVTKMTEEEIEAKETTIKDNGVMFN